MKLPKKKSLPGKGATMDAANKPHFNTTFVSVSDLLSWEDAKLLVDTAFENYRGHPENVFKTALTKLLVDITRDSVDIYKDRLNKVTKP